MIAMMNCSIATQAEEITLVQGVPLSEGRDPNSTTFTPSYIWCSIITYLKKKIIKKTT